MAEEICIRCDKETGRAGKADDSIFTPDLGLGPYCEDCFTDGSIIDDERNSRNFFVEGIAKQETELESLRAKCEALEKDKARVRDLIEEIHDVSKVAYGNQNSMVLAEYIMDAANSAMSAEEKS